MRETRQQRRKARRTANKQIVSEAKQLHIQRMMDAHGTETLANYQLKSKAPALLLFCMPIEADTTLDDWIYACRDIAETLTDDKTPKWCVLIRKDDTTPLPAPRREMMKICTRLFRKVVPKKPCLFLEMTQAEFDAGAVGKQVMEFMCRFAELPEKREGPIPDWMHEYLFMEVQG